MSKIIVTYSVRREDIMRAAQSVARQRGLNQVVFHSLGEFQESMDYSKISVEIDADPSHKERGLQESIVVSLELDYVNDDSYIASVHMKGRGGNNTFYDERVKEEHLDTNFEELILDVVKRAAERNQSDNLALRVI